MKEKQEPKPMLAMPMGQKDYESGRRMAFLKTCQPILLELGWTIGVELKGSILGWGKECLKELKSLGGRATWHLPSEATQNLAKGLDQSLINIATYVYRLNQDDLLNLEAITIHCAPAISHELPLESAYESPISAEEMLIHIKAQVEPIKELNKWAGGILQIENLDMLEFRDNGCKTPTYLKLPLGVSHDLLWLKNQTGARITFDCEHFFGARDFLYRCLGSGWDYLKVLDAASYSISNREISYATWLELSELAWYWLAKGSAPLGIGHLDLLDFVQLAQPKLFHLGGSIRATDENGRIATHLPSFDSFDARQALNLALTRSMQSIDTIGCVIEVDGQVGSSKYSEWSPRTYNDEVAKMQAYLYVMNEIDALNRAQ